LPSLIDPHLPVSVVPVDGVLPRQRSDLGLLALDVAAPVAVDLERPFGSTPGLFENGHPGCFPAFPIHSLDSRSQKILSYDNIIGSSQDVARNHGRFGSHALLYASGLRG